MSYHLQDASDFTSRVRRLGSVRTVEATTLQTVNIKPSGTATKFFNGSPQGIGNQRAYDVGLAECQLCTTSGSPTAATGSRSFRLRVLYNLLRS